MTYQIYWTDPAKKSYEEVLNYLETQWSKREVTNLISRTELVLRLLANSPRISGDYSNHTSVRTNPTQ
jgi:plasmid stabilization system protein ParE